jgi:hypothetical protein
MATSKSGGAARVGGSTGATSGASRKYTSAQISQMTSAGTLRTTGNASVVGCNVFDTPGVLKIDNATATNFTVTVIDLSIGRISLTIANAVTAQLKPGNYVFDVEMTDPAGKKTRILEGQITVFAEVTR